MYTVLYKYFKSLKKQAIHVKNQPFMEMYMDVLHFLILNYPSSEFRMKNVLLDTFWTISGVLKQIHKPGPVGMDYIQN